MKQVLATEIDSQGITDISLIGPSPAFFQRLKGKFRWQIILRGHEPALFLSPISIPQGWTIDVDPIGIA